MAGSGDGFMTDREAVTNLKEKLLSLASPLSLYAEEIDPCNGRHLGNFPQGFTHLALINAVMHVIEAEEAAAQAARPSPERLVF